MVAPRQPAACIILADRISLFHRKNRTEFRRNLHRRAALGDKGLARPELRAARTRRRLFPAHPPAGRRKEMLQPADSYEDLMRDFAWDLPARYNIATAVADRWAEREPGAHLPRIFRARRQPQGHGLRNPRRDGGAPSPALSARPASAVATASRSCCRRASRRSSRMWRSTSSAPSRFPWRCCSGPKRWNTGSPCRAPRRSSSTAAGSARSPPSATGCRH